MESQRPMLHVAKKADRLIFGYDGEEIVFEKIPTNNTKQGSTDQDSLMFVELSELWETFDDKAHRELFACYKEINELRLETKDIILSRVPRLVQTIAKYHTLAAFKKLYPLETVWMPDNLEVSLDNLSPNYSEGMTYVISDYYELVMEALLVKPFIPIFMLMNAYLVGKSHTIQDKRSNIYNYADCFAAVAGTDIGSSPAIAKLELFLAEAVEKAKKDSNSNGFGGVDPSYVAAYSGFGTDMLDEYMLSFTVVDILALSPVCAKPQTNIQDNGNLVTKIYFKIKPEVNRKLSSNISEGILKLKPNPSNFSVNGEENKLSSIDMVEARADAPIKEAIRTGVYFKNYRQVIKNYGLEVPVADVKTLIDSSVEKRTGGFTMLHNWLVAAVLHHDAHRKTYIDLEPDEFAYGIGIAQAIYINMGFWNIAQLLSCEAIPGNMGHRIEAVRDEIKKDVDIFYPQRYRLRKGIEISKPVMISLTTLVEQHISPYFFHLKCSEEAALLLRCKPKIPSYVPDKDILSDLAEMLTMVARMNLKRKENKKPIGVF